MILRLIFLLLLTGCNPNQHVWDELERCKEEYKEDCTLVVIPLSKSHDIQLLHKLWGKPDN